MRHSLGCPGWCTEQHDGLDHRSEDAEHLRPFLQDAGGAFVALHRLDAFDETRVWLDLGPVGELTPLAARRLALAILDAADAAGYRLG